MGTDSSVISFKNDDLIKEHNDLFADYYDIISGGKKALVAYSKTKEGLALAQTVMALLKYDTKKQNFDEKVRTINEIENYNILWN